jgi:hypothetical protein
LTSIVDALIGGTRVSIVTFTGAQAAPRRIDSYAGALETGVLRAGVSIVTLKVRGATAGQGGVRTDAAVQTEVQGALEGVVALVVPFTAVLHRFVHAAVRLAGGGDARAGLLTVTVGDAASQDGLVDALLSDAEIVGARIPVTAIISRLTTAPSDGRVGA